MTSKEVLEELKTFIGFIRQEVFYEQAYKCIEILEDIIKSLQERLERLEVVEINSDKVIKDSVKLINKNLELQLENEKLKNALAFVIERIETIKLKDSEIEFLSVLMKELDLEVELKLKEVLGE